MELLRYKPLALWRLDGSTPFVDYSGYDRSGTMSGTPVEGLALTSDATYSQMFDSTHTATFATPVYLQDKESDPFTLAITLLPILRSTTGPQQVLSRQDVSSDELYDGFALDGTVLSFGTQYTSTGSAICSYDFQFRRKMNVVGVHTQKRNMLYVDGELVADVEITEEQQADTYLAGSSNFYSGATASTQAIRLNNVAIYNTALSEKQIKAIYKSHERKSARPVPPQFEGEIVPTINVREPLKNFTFETDDEWELGMTTLTVIENDQVIPEMRDELTVDSKWDTSIDLYDGGTATALNEITLNWVGENVTVETSVNGGTTWVEATRGLRISNVPVGFGTTNKVLLVRARFAAGLTTAYLSFLQVRVYVGNTAEPLNGRAVTYTGQSMRYELDPELRREDYGVNIDSGSIVIGADPNDAVARTIEVWLKPTSSSSFVFTSIGDTYTGYSGGDSGITQREGEWQIYHFVLDGDHTGSITISGNGVIGQIAIYATALDATEISNIVDNYTGVIKSTTTDSFITITEPAAPTEIYAYDWSRATTTANYS